MDKDSNTVFHAGIQAILQGPFLSYPLIFSAFLAFFYFSNPWYPAAKLHVNGVIGELPARVMIHWTSGHGLNGYEMNRYTLQRVPPSPDPSTVNLTISRTGKKHSAAADSQVILNRILVDGKPIDFPSEQLDTALDREDGLLIFKEKNARLSLAVKPKYHLLLEFLAYNYAGEAEVDFAGQISRHNLYSAWDRTAWSRDSIVAVNYWLVQPDGTFAVSMDMPRYPVNEIQVSAKKPLSHLSLQVVTEAGQSIRLESAIPISGGMVYETGQTDRQLKRFFHPQRFVLQFGFALLTTWLVFGGMNFCLRFSSFGDIFTGRKRYIFWGLFISSLSVFALWHIAFWPGIASTDSLKIWRAVHIPGMYLGDHPPLNVIFYQYLSHFWDNIAVVPIVQNILTSLLLSWIFFSLSGWGVSLVVVVPFFLFTIFSVPIGLYSSILWKDIPFALLIVFLGFRFADMYYRKRNGGVQVSRYEWFVLFLLVVALCGFRYNGAVYLVVIPLLIIALGLVAIRKKYIFICFCLIALGGMFYSVSQYLGFSASSYFTTQVKTYFGQVQDRMSGEYLQDRWRRYLGIFDINQTAMQWDHVGNCLYGRYDNNFLRRLQWNDVYPYLPLPRADMQKKMARTALAIYKQSYQKPWVYLSWNPVYLLMIMPFLLLFYRRLPMTAVFTGFILAEVAALVCIDIFNWRYYYFAHFASYLILPLVAADLTRAKQKPVA